MLRVVLADDERKILLLLQKLIDWESLGYEIVGTANDGIRALQLVEQLQPELLITDVRMPGCDGIELIRRAKELQPKLHFIVISGYRQFEYAQNALKYGVEDYLLKPLKQEELSDILLRLKDKMGKEAAIEYQLEKSEEQLQKLVLDSLQNAAERQLPFWTAEQAEKEYGLHFGDGSYFVAVVKPDTPNAAQYVDGYRLMMQHLLEAVRREVRPIADEYAIAVRREGIVMLLYMRAYDAAAVRRCFGQIRREIQKQRELFWDVRGTICVGSRRPCPEQLSDSLREALWLCRDRLCHIHAFRDAEMETIAFSDRYQMDIAQKKRFQEATEYLDEQRFHEELDDSYHEILQRQPINGQMLTDWFHQILEASLYGLRQNGDMEDGFEEQMEDAFWYCIHVQDIMNLLETRIGQQIQRLNKEKALRESRPIIQAKRYIQQHYQETVRLEDVSNAVGFNATYFSALFKKETGQNFMDYLTEMRINKAKELLCDDTLSVQDVVERVGYRDLKYFSRLFKKTTGVSPSDYKKLYK